MKNNDKLWFEAQSTADVQRYTSDGLSLYDLENLDAILMGRGDWFHAQLIRLFGKADENNWRRLSMAFPGTMIALASRRVFVPEPVGTPAS